MDNSATPKVSIIIPVFNVEKYLAQCLDSALNQTYRNKEIVIIDDGSKDDCPAIISSYKTAHPEIKTITTTNNGQSRARNIGLDHATGDYIIFLDSDDWIEANTLEKCLAIMRQYDVDIVLFNATSFADGTTEAVANSFKYSRPTDLLNKKMDSRVLFSKFISAKNYIVSPCLYIYRRQQFSNLKFHAGIIHEDNLFTTRLLIDHPSTSAMCIDEVLFHRRVRPNSTMTQNKSIKHISGYLTVSGEMLNHPVLQHTNPAKISLNNFIQTMLAAASHDVAKVYPNIPWSVRKKILTLFFKTDVHRSSLKSALLCLFPELVTLKQWLYFDNKKP